MSHSRQTNHYGLPLYNGTDIINPLTDFNDANEAIDTALYNANQSASSANTKADTAVEAVAGYDTRITQAETKADNALTKNSDTEKMIANQFDPLKVDGYAIGDSVIYNDKLYTFINPHTGAWDAGDVVNQPITDAVKSTIAEGKAEIEQETQEAIAEIATQTQKVTATQKMIAQPFSSDVSYSAGVLVTYADKLYKFNSDHNGAWTGSDVTELTVGSEIKRVDDYYANHLRTKLVATINTEAGITWETLWVRIREKMVEVLGDETHTFVVLLSFDNEDATEYDGLYSANHMIQGQALRKAQNTFFVQGVFISADGSVVQCERLTVTTTGVVATDQSADVQPVRTINIYIRE